MITKAIVEEVVDNNILKIRIPIYNKAANDATSTPNNQLTEAGINTIPGIKSHYTKGDVVIIGFEEDQVGKPIVLGQLQSQLNSNASSDITTESLTVNVNYKLPAESTTIKLGGVQTSNSGLVSGSVDQAILMVQQRINILEKKLDYNVGDIYLTTREESPTEQFYSGTWQEAAQSFTLQFENSTVPVYIWQKIAE